MSRETFMKELEYLLQDIGEEERADALAYYRDYLDEAGPEREEQALAEFGSPERVAAMIRASIDGNMEEGGEFTETGYGDERFKDPGYQVQKRYDVPDISPEPEKTGGETAGRKGETPRKPESGTSRALKLVLWAILLIVALPVIFGVGGSVLSAVMGVVIVIFVIFFCIALGAVACLLGGIAAVVGGGIYLFADALNGALAIGFGLILFGGGLLLLVLSVWFSGNCLTDATGCCTAEGGDYEEVRHCDQHRGNCVHCGGGNRGDGGLRIRGQRVERSGKRPLVRVQFQLGRIRGQRWKHRGHQRVFL